MAASDGARVLGYRRLRDLDAQFLKLPVNPRRAPEGLAGHRRMSARTSGATAGRPGPFRRLFQAQKSLKPARCHRITVAGWTTETASVQPPHRRDSRTQSSRSEGRRRGRGAVRWRTASWCRNARFSSTRDALGPDPAEEAGEDEDDHAGHHRSGRPKVNGDEADGVNTRKIVLRAVGQAVGCPSDSGEPAVHVALHDAGGVGYETRLPQGPEARVTTAVDQ